MDPLSIISGTVGIADVCWRVIQYLNDVRKASAKVQGEINALQHELSSLKSVNEALEKIGSTTNQPTPSPTIQAAKDDISHLWADVKTIRQGCKTTLEDLEKLLTITFEPMIHKIIGNGNAKVTGKIDGLRKQIRRQAGAADLSSFRLQLANFQGRLQILLTALNIAYTCNNNGSTNLLTEKIQQLGYSLQSHIASLQVIPAAHVPNSAVSIASSLSFNKHFHTPRSVSSIFTGRVQLLRDLGDVIFSSVPCSIQKRFVLYGLGGSGKTEFCCKFAQDYQHLFWGVFWIDATSPTTLKHTYSKIAEIGGVEPNIQAAKNWLSGLDQPWLLLIENANDNSDVLDLGELFPVGRRGCVLITTRNPSHKTHGTVGSQSLHFETMDVDEANELLLRAASIPRPWESSTLLMATNISKELGCLPLALVHAGRAILDNLCTFNDYLDYFWRYWAKIRLGHSNVEGFLDRESNMRVYSTYEILFAGLETKKASNGKDHVAASDAIEILQVFSFLNWESVPIGMLIKAVENPKIEQETQDALAVEKKRLPQVDFKTRAWSQYYLDFKLFLNFVVFQDRTPPVLPTVLREFDIDRLRKALGMLVQLSLITRHETTETYSMHPLVHMWVRQRPEMSTGEQAVWCQAATTILAQCILLPPLGRTESDFKLRASLLPHVIHVRRCQTDVEHVIETRQMSRSKLWPVVKKTILSRMVARNMAKLSMVYSQGGMWAEAENLQRQVKDFVSQTMGMTHPIAIDIALALSASLLNQTRANEAAELQKQALEACILLYGKENQKTLKVMDMLATSYVFGGRFQAALTLYESAIEKSTRILGSDHEDTLLTVDNLGRLMMRYQRHSEARDLHHRASLGLEMLFGKDDLRTLAARESLAMAYLALDDGDLPTAHDIMQEVLSERIKQLGKEQPYTLLAVCNLGRVKSSMDDCKEAEEMMTKSLAIAIRNLGENHQGVLMGKAHLANVLARQKRYKEAEDILLEVVQPGRYSTSVREDGEHPDRIAALWYLMQCYLVQDKNEEALKVNYKLHDAIERCGGQGLGKNHALSKKTLERRKELEVLLGSPQTQKLPPGISTRQPAGGNLPVPRRTT